MTEATPPREGMMRPLIRLDIKVQPPGQPAFAGSLKAVMYQHGAVHHYRIAAADGVTWLVPPAWLSAHSRDLAEMATDYLGSRMLHAWRTVPHAFLWKAMAAVTGMPDGLTPEEMVARLAQRQSGETVA